MMTIVMGAFDPCIPTHTHTFVKARLMSLSLKGLFGLREREGSKVELIENRLILSQFLFTLLYSLSRT